MEDIEEVEEWMVELRERIEGRDIYTEDGIRKINRGDCTFLIYLHGIASFPLSLLTSLTLYRTIVPPSITLAW